MYGLSFEVESPKSNLYNELFSPLDRPGVRENLRSVGVPEENSSQT